MSYAAPLPTCRGTMTLSATGAAAEKRPEYLGSYVPTNLRGEHVYRN